MSGTQAQRRAAQSIESDGSSITPMGTCSAREGGESIYGLYPSKQAAADGVEQGTTLIVGYHAPTSTVLLTPAHLADESDWTGTRD